MNRIFTFLIPLLVVVSGIKSAKAQDAHFSQFYITPMGINPAATGTMREDLRATAFYKDQWRSAGSPYKTMFTSFDAKVYPKKEKDNFFGFGMQIFSDKAGETQMGVSMANLSLSYHVKLNRYHTIGAGIQGGAGQRSIKLQNLRWDNQYDGDIFDGSRPGENIPMPSISMFDIGAGVHWNHVRDELFSANGGVSVFQANRPFASHYVNNTEPMHMRIVMHGGADFALENTNTSLQPAILFMRQGPAHEITAGGLVRYSLGYDSKYTGLRNSSAFSAGAFYRLRDAVILVTRFDVRNDWTLGFSYDVNVSRLRAATGGRGGMEISLIWKGIVGKKSAARPTSPRHR
jgi:type IX secretion system PorP/SprF family membrane protein